MVDDSSPHAPPDRPRLSSRVAVVRSRPGLVVGIGAMLLLATTGAAILAGGGRGPRLVAETATAEAAPVVDRATAPGEIVAVSARGLVALDSQTGAERRVLVGPSWPPEVTGARVQGISVTADGRRAYFAVVSDDSNGSIYVVETAGGTDPSFVASGISPAVSPDGGRLAFAAPASEPAGVGPVTCCNTIAVVDLGTGARRTWSFAGDDAALDWMSQAQFTKLAWAPDARRLAFTVSYEGDSVGVLDTELHQNLSQATEVVVPGGGGDSRHPAWQASSGRLAVLNQAFECCFEDDYAGPPRTLLLDLAGGPSHDALPAGTAPEWLEFDPSGHHLLSVEAGRLFRRTDGRTPVLLGEGVHAADW